MGASTAAFFEPYTDDPTTQGLLIHEPERLEQLDRRGRYRGIPARCPRRNSPLSSLEVEVLLYVEGRSYQEIGEELDRHVKSIDNALQRIKRKLGMHLAEREDADRQDELALIA